MSVRNILIKILNDRFLYSFSYLSCEFPTLLHSWSLEKVPFRVEPPPIGHHRENPPPSERKSPRATALYLKCPLCRQVVANQEGSQMSGYLRFKKGRHGWKKAWFVLKNNVLYSYKASSVSGRDTMNKIWRMTKSKTVKLKFSQSLSRSLDQE